MSSGSDRLAGILADEALAAAMVPWACPSDFGPGRRYQLEELIGVGRDSLIYRATDRKLSSEGFAAQVAVKVASSGGRVSFEALSARRVSHPHVLAILDHGQTAEGVAYVVAEFVDGGDLAGKPGPWPVREAVAFVAKLARGVQAVHAAGVVHCDLKPANVLLTREGEPKIGDFDLCHAPDDPGADWRGNLAFMPPEQLARDPSALTPPADIYALGGILLWLLTGRCPNGDAADAIVETLPKRTEPLRLNVECDLDRICRRALAVRREDRHHSAGELADDLDRWLRREPIPWMRPSLWRRGSLLARRRPAAAVAAGAVLLGAVSGTAVWLHVQARARTAEQEARARADAIMRRDIESIKATARGHISSMFNATLSGDTSGLIDRVLPTLVWLEWIVDSPVLDDNARISLSADRVMALQTILASQQIENQPPRLDHLLTRYTLAYFLLEQNDAAEATKHLEAIREVWTQRLHEEDPIWPAVAAMEICASAIEAARRGEPAATVNQILSDADRQLGSGGFEPVRRLLTRAGLRLATP